MPGQRPTSASVAKMKPVYGRKQFSNATNNPSTGAPKTLFGSYSQAYGTITSSGLATIQGKKSWLGHRARKIYTDESSFYPLPTPPPRRLRELSSLYSPAPPLRPKDVPQPSLIPHRYMDFGYYWMIDSIFTAHCQYLNIQVFTNSVQRANHRWF